MGQKCANFVDHMAVSNQINKKRSWLFDRIALIFLVTRLIFNILNYIRSKTVVRLFFPQKFRAYVFNKNYFSRNAFFQMNSKYWSESPYLYISDPAIDVNGVSGPRDWAKPMAMAVLPVPGAPAIKHARPAIFPSLIISKTIPAARLALVWPTRPSLFGRGSRVSSKPRPLMWEWAPIRSIRVTSLTSATFKLK